MVNALSRVPVALLTGLRRGDKTARSDAPLADVSGPEVAAVVSEFSDGQLDPGLIQTVDEDIVLTKPEYLCRSIQSDLSQAPQKLAMRSHASFSSVMT